ncbi:4Fe-4S binding protein [Alkalicella caledoniensis]|uniref:4Fe-4S binding protein n=1 Tax=Alkalicella caledoniensis TaxID=2731377 RepID=A0A7G9W4V9_ALKCA|nr:4Fe-4S binding protein [Alkalicella caledoniensis]QNO13721.1 4Fe-4S binding protein [Alkalicella caledoniensis]
MTFGEKSTKTRYVLCGVKLPIHLREQEGLKDLSTVYFSLFNKFRQGYIETFSYLDKWGYQNKAVSPISLKEDLRGLARKSGVGERGLNRSILHDKYGGNLLFSAFYTSAPIKAFTGHSPDNCIKCGKCADICPGKAINLKGVMVYRCAPFSLRACQKCLDVCPVGEMNYKSVYMRGE